MSSIQTSQSSAITLSAQQNNSFAKKLDSLASQLSQLSSELKAANKNAGTQQDGKNLPTGEPKLAAWQKPAEDVTTIDINQGDTLTKIASKTGKSVQELVALNGIKNKDLIKAGRQIIISDQPSNNSIAQTEQVGPTKARASARAAGVSMRDRDTMIRTVIGEANNQGQLGQEAVAHVLMNRSSDERFPSNLSSVAKQRKQFSAWNSGVGGNSLVRKYNPGSTQYERAAKAVDRVLSGQSQDPTGGATHYYSPAGMRAHVARGEQNNLLPRWLQDMNAERGDSVAKIGGHIFTGKARIG